MADQANTVMAADDFRRALDELDAAVSRLADQVSLPELLRLLGQLQTFGERLGQVAAYAEHVALQAGARTGTMPDGTYVKRESGRWSYVWDSHRRVIREAAPDVLKRLDDAGAGDLAAELVGRIATMLPKNVPWKATEVGKYTLPGDLRTGEQGRATLKVTLPSETGAPAV